MSLKSKRILPAILTVLISTFSVSLAESSNQAEQAVIVHFYYGSTNLSRLFQLEDKLEQVTTQAKVGEYDGHEIDINGETVDLYMYGPSADRLFETVKPVLISTKYVKNATVKLRYGPPKAGVKEKVLDLKR